MHYLIEVSRSFRAMTTGIEAVVCVTPDQKTAAVPALDRVQSLFIEVERNLSRFHSDSELSRLNQAAGQDFNASPLLFEVVTAAVKSAELTGGIFDPTILPYLVSAGYDRSYETLQNCRQVSRKDCRMPRPTWREIRLDPETLSIFLPAGCSIDLGGIAKSWVVDRAAGCLEKFHNFAVNAGGDIAVGGTQTDGSPWTVGIADPLNQKPNLLVLTLSGGAVCTSTTIQRQWLADGIRQHHLIDPRTGSPADSGVISATVTSASAVMAETITKAALILGPQAGLRLIESFEDTEGMLILDDGSRLYSPGFRFSY